MMYTVKCSFFFSLYEYTTYFEERLPISGRKKAFPKATNYPMKALTLERALVVAMVGARLRVTAYLPPGISKDERKGFRCHLRVTGPHP